MFALCDELRAVPAPGGGSDEGQTAQLVSEVEWESLCRGLLNEGICGIARKTDIHHVKGQPLFSGLFGAPREETVNGVSVNRLIMSLIPLNRINLPSDARRHSAPFRPGRLYASF